MNVIRLDSGQSFETPIAGFIARIEFDLSSGVGGSQGFELKADRLETNRRGNMLAVRNPLGNTEIIISPDHTRSEFASGTNLFVSITLEDAHGAETRLDLPTFAIGGLRSFPVLGLFTSFDSVRLQAGDANTDSSLDAFSSGVRAALRRTLDQDAVSEPPRTDVTVLVDISASMKISTSPELFDLMCAFATGVVSTSSQGHSVSLLNSSSSVPVERLAAAEEIRSLSTRLKPLREVGWSVDLNNISPNDAVIIISDDLPIEVVKLSNRMHLLSSRKPLVDHGISMTYFDAKLIQAIKEQDMRVLAEPARLMFDALTDHAEVQQSSEEK